MERRFGNAPLDGQTITLDGSAYTIVGIMPRATGLPNTQSAVWLPFVYNPFATRREVTVVYALGRLKSAVTPQVADAELASVALSLSRDYPGTQAGRGFTLVPLKSMVVGDVRTTVLVLFAAVGCLILIACANVANVVLARATSRHREIAVRAALGASRGQILQQLVVESVLLAAGGGVAGIALAWWGTGVVSAMFETRLPVGTSVRLETSVLMFAAALSVVTGVVFGLAPALHATRMNLNDTLKDATRSGSASGLRVRGALVVAEVALSLVP
jgi:ABC-type antimicrobial peptide transport system permease subunit